MRNKTELTEANRQYATAYAAHYTEHDLPAAMHPEAEYSRVQIQNIVNAVVPKQELLDAEMEMALTHFEHSA